MNDKQKQIEEMGRVLSTVKKCGAFTTSNCIKRKCEYPHYSGVTCIAEHQAEALYNAGYQKIPEGSVVLSRSEHQQYLAYKLIEPQIKGCLDREKALEEQLKEAHKQAVKEFAKMYKDHVKNYTGMFTEEGFMVNLQAVLTAVDFIAAKEFEVEVE